MAKARSAIKARTGSKARKASATRGRSSAKAKTASVPASDTVKYTRYSRWTRWTKGASKWQPKQVHESEVPHDHRLNMMATTMDIAAQIPCSDTVIYTHTASGWIRRTRVGNHWDFTPVSEDDVPENCK